MAAHGAADLFGPVFIDSSRRSRTGPLRLAYSLESFWKMQPRPLSPPRIQRR